MKQYFGPTVLAVVIAGPVTPFDTTAAAQSIPGQTGDRAAVVDVLGGSAIFDAGTNISAINVHGKSTNLGGRAQIRQAGDVITIEQMEARLAVKTITTGMGLRDEHMRKYVFTTGDGQTPDLKFTGDRADCASVPGGGGESICKISGQLEIRGTPRPFAITLKVNKAGDAYRAAGDGTVKLSAYSIPQPSQFGVTTTDDVKLHIEFTAKPPITNQLEARAGGIR